MTTSTFVHVCSVKSMDPRKQNTCGLCGRPMPKPLARDKEFERQLIREATAGLMIDPTALIMFAQRRADDGEHVYKLDFPSLQRDLAQETLDEIGDGANYVVWFLDAIRRELLEGGDRVMHLQRALRHLALAFEEVRSAR